MMVRWLVIFSVLIWVVELDDLLPTFSLLFLCILGLRLQGFKLEYFVKSFRLLLWLFVPTLLFHGFFTPGIMINYPIYIPLSLEGFERGLFLCARISLVFFAALLVSRVFTKMQWIAFVEHTPFAQALKPYFLLLPLLQQRMSNIIFQQKVAWKQQGQHWSALPTYILQSIEAVIGTGKEEAKDLWDNWGMRLTDVKQTSIPLWSMQNLMYILFMVSGWCLLWWM